ncbi:MAG: class I SAM-dependent methyltransferase [Gammaproteobacteria bacterium]|nr:class I SAM-dependent methyltransferase [Gammaproteobacteria bacterium]
MRFKDISRAIRAPLNRNSAIKKINQFHSRETSISETVKTGMNLGSNGNYRIDSQQIPQEIETLVSRVAELKPQNILEIGTCNGGTFFMWANLASHKAITCDLIGNKHRIDLFKYFPRPDSTCQTIFIEGDSHTQEMKQRVMQTLDGEQVDFLFIDGDHSEKGVEMDYEMYHELVRPGGIIAFHDIIENQPVKGNQVYYFWQRLKEKVKYEEVIGSTDQCGFGIGIVYV